VPGKTLTAMLNIECLKHYSIVPPESGKSDETRTAGRKLMEDFHSLI
jgi:hypothetical protein